ncbi:hypothetical protein EVAR_39185_1 [Eumeta japonica]|uniref:Uncharacterized protein n=1 Tax=Eumeta variegata TaxID=151549 RepID=A0A4C1VNL9_EUMVA|nr:hypothetical protein EVAR_39185_1 [Eumeta japonica]
MLHSSVTCSKYVVCLCGATSTARGALQLESVQALCEPAMSPKRFTISASNTPVPNVWYSCRLAQFAETDGFFELAFGAYLSQFVSTFHLVNPDHFSHLHVDEKQLREYERGIEGDCSGSQHAGGRARAGGRQRAVSGCARARNSAGARRAPDANKLLLAYYLKMHVKFRSLIALENPTARPLLEIDGAA